MHCHECNTELNFEKREYRFIESGLENVVLITKVARCPCGDSPMLPLSGTGMYLAIAHELCAKTELFSVNEFVFLRKALATLAEDSLEFADCIALHPVFWNAIKHNDFSKLDTSSREALEQSMKEHCNNEDDGRVNEWAMREINRCIAYKLGMKSEKELIQFRGPVTPELNLNALKLAEKAVEVCGNNKYPSRSTFEQIEESGIAQTIYVTVPD